MNILPEKHIIEKKNFKSETRELFALVDVLTTHARVVTSEINKYGFVQSCKSTR